MNKHTALDASLDNTASLLDERDRGVGLVITVYRQLQRWGNNPPGAEERLSEAITLLTANSAQLRSMRKANCRADNAAGQRVIKFPGGGG